MKYLKSYSQINETLRSDEIEIVCKKLSNFFDKLGFNKKIGWGSEVESPNYQIYSDRESIKSSIEEYRNPSNRLKKLLKKYHKSAYKIRKRHEENLEDFKYGDIFIFTDKNTPEITKNLLHLIDSMGYFIATSSGEWGEGPRKISVEEIKDQDSISISIEPKYDSEVDFQDEYVYHTTDKKNLEKIMKIGLVPKTKNTRSFYPERIYLSPNIKYNNSIKDQLGSDKAGEYVDLKIKKFHGLKLYKDVRFKGGFYTYTNIPPKYIEVIP